MAIPDEQDPFLEELRQCKPMGLLPGGKARALEPPPPVKQGGGWKLEILRLLAERPCSGKELLAMLPGSRPERVYPMLEYLQDEGWVVEVEGRRYQITEAGRARLKGQKSRSQAPLGLELELLRRAVESAPPGDSERICRILRRAIEEVGEG
jgi:DNA-binding PadR family transcriptional regulator